MNAVFWPPHSHVRMGLGSGIIPYWEDRVPTASASPVICFTLSVCSLVLLKCVHHLVPGQLHHSISFRERMGSFRKRMGSFTQWHERGLWRLTALWQLPAGSHWPWQMNAEDWNWSSSVSCLCESSTVPSLAQLCGVFLADSDTQMQWAKVLRFLLLVLGGRFCFLPAPK